MVFLVGKGVGRGSAREKQGENRMFSLGVWPSETRERVFFYLSLEGLSRGIAAICLGHSKFPVMFCSPFHLHLCL